MFHNTKDVNALSDYRLSVQFCEGVTKIYDVKPLFEKLPVFGYFKEHEDEFFEVSVDIAVTESFGMTTWICRAMNFGKTEFRLRFYSIT